MIQIKLFSHLEICQSSVSPYRLQVRKTGLLLAYLACFPERSHLRSHLATLLWPDADENAARANLRTSLNELKKRLGGTGMSTRALMTSSHDVALNADYVTSDVGEFRAAIRKAASRSLAEQTALLEQAVHLYRGPLLEEFAVHWVERERSVLAAMCQKALTQLIALHREAGSLEQALEYAQQAVEIDPFDSETHLQLMRLYFDLQDYGQTVNQYAKLARRFKKNELSTPPEARALRRLALAASRGQADLTARAAPPASGLKPSNLRPALTSFVGRNEERKELRSLLGPLGPRLLTLTGPGGSGKTRLALEAGREACSRFDERVYWADMAEIDRPERILNQLAQALLPDDITASTALGRLQRRLGARPVLLILDNFEHLVEGGGRHVVELLHDLPSLTLLVTSRQRLQIQGEQVLPVAPLPIPGGHQTIEEIQCLDSVQLLVERIRSLKPEFTLTSENVSLIAALCNALDGVPLALEIAAAWCDTLSLGTLVRGMEHRFELLVNPLQDADTRHASLWNVVDLSYRQMSPALKDVFVSLSVFRNGWTLDAARAVCIPHATLMTLRQLQERSLIAVREVEGEMRFYFLETLREFAHLHLPEAERQVLLRRHAAYFLTQTLTVRSLLRSEASPVWLERLAHEHDNMLLALETWRHQERYDHYLRLAAALKVYWIARDYTRLGYDLLKEGLSAYSVADSIRAEALRALVSCREFDDPEQTRAWLAESLRITQVLNDHVSSAEALTQLAKLTDPADLALVKQARSLYGEANDEWGEANCLHLEGGALFAKHAYAQAEPLFWECVRLRERIGDRRGQIFTFHYLGNIAAIRNDYARARDAYDQSLSRARKLKSGLAEGMTLTLVGMIDYRCEDLPSARRSMESALELLDRAYAPIYEIMTRTHLARIAFRQRDISYARSTLQAAAQRLLTPTTLSSQYIRLGSAILRLAVLVAGAQNDYPKACKFRWVAEQITAQLELPLESYEIEEQESGRTLIETYVSPEARAALEEGTRELPIQKALELILTL